MLKDECLLGSNSDTSYEGNFHDSNIGLISDDDNFFVEHLSDILITCELTLGEYEPNDEECEWPSDSEDEDDEDDKEEKEKKKKEQEVRRAHTTLEAEARSILDTSENSNWT